MNGYIKTKSRCINIRTFLYKFLAVLQTAMVEGNGIGARSSNPEGRVLPFPLVLMSLGKICFVLFPLQLLATGK